MAVIRRLLDRLALYLYRKLDIESRYTNPIPPMGSRELVEYLGSQIESLRKQRSQAMAAYQSRLHSKGGG